MRSIVRHRPVIVLIGITFVVAIAFSAWRAYRREQSRRLLVAEILQHGAYMEFARTSGFLAWMRSWREGRTGNRVVELKGPEVDDAWLAKWDHLHAVSPTTLILDSTGVSAEGLAGVVASSDELWSLAAAHVPLSDAVIAELAERPVLMSLDLAGSTLTDEQMARLPLSQLGSLSIAGTPVTAEGLAGQLQECGMLGSLGIDGGQCSPEVVAAWSASPTHSLSLAGSKTTDETLELIGKLPLQLLLLLNSSVSDAAVAKYRAEHPKCQVRRIDL